jgi:hypothetical protein
VLSFLCRSSHRLWARGGQVIKPAGHIFSPTERPAGCCYQWVQCQTALMGGGVHLGHEVVRAESPNGASGRASPPRVGNGRNPGCSHDPTGLNGAQCVSEGARARTSKHLVDGKHPGAGEKPWLERRHALRSHRGSRRFKSGHHHNGAVKREPRALSGLAVTHRAAKEQGRLGDADGRVIGNAVSATEGFTPPVAQIPASNSGTARCGAIRRHQEVAHPSLPTAPPVDAIPAGTQFPFTITPAGSSPET